MNKQYKKPSKADMRVLEKYGLGGWLKDNAGVIGGVTGSLIGTAIAPGIGTKIGGTIGGMIGGNIQGEQEQQLEPEVQKNYIASNPTGSVYAMGGNMKNELQEINGNKHEQGGVQITKNAEAEGGETKLEDYIYSDRLLANPETKQTYADVSKKINKKYSKRNDPITERSKNMELGKLAMQQEAEREAMMGTQSQQYALGGNMKYGNGGILDWVRENQGSYTNADELREGLRQSGYASNQLQDFLDKQIGGDSPATGGRGYGKDNYDNVSNMTYDAFNKYNTGINQRGTSEMDQFIQPKDIGFGKQDYTNKNVSSDTYSQYIAEQNQLPIADNTDEVNRMIDDEQMYYTDKDDNQLSSNPNNKTGKGWGIAGLPLTQMGSLYDIYRGLKGKDDVNFDRTSSSYLDRVDPTRAVQEARAVGSAGNEAVRQTAQGAGSYMSNIGANIGRTQRATSGIYSDYAAKNAAIGNQEAMMRQRSNFANANIQQQEAIAKQQEKDIASNTLQKGLVGLSGGIGAGIQDRNMRKQIATMKGDEILRATLERLLARK